MFEDTETPVPIIAIRSDGSDTVRVVDGHTRN